MRFEPYPEGFEPPRLPEGSRPPQPPLERVVPVEYEFEALGRRCFVTSLECWRDAFVVRYWEFLPPCSSAEEAGREGLVMQEFLMALRGLSRQDIEEVLGALGGLNDMDAVEEVVEALRGKDWPERREILEAIGKPAKRIAGNNRGRYRRPFVVTRLTAAPSHVARWRDDGKPTTAPG